VRSEDEYFDDIQDVKVTKDMLDLAKHIVLQKTGEFVPEKFEDHYEAALAELINQKRSGKAITSKPRPKGENVVDVMDALKRSIGQADATPAKSKKPRRAAAGNKTSSMATAEVEEGRTMTLTHAYEEMAPEKRPQDPHLDGTGLRFKTLDHGGEYPDTMPQAIKLIDAEGRSCIYLPITQNGKVVDS